MSDRPPQRDLHTTPDDHRPPGGDGRGLTGGLAWVIVLNGLLVVRPEDLYPEVGELRLYLIIIVVCLVWNSASILRELNWSRLSRNPLLVFVLGILCAVVMSHVGNFRLGRGMSEGLEFLKLVAYYLVIVAAIKTRAHLRWFLTAYLLFILVQATTALAQYHGYIDVETLRQHDQREIDPETGEQFSLVRLCGGGIYNDPNDLSLLLTAAMLIALNGALGSGGILRCLWLLPFAYCGYALTLTKSRGGLLMAAVGLSVYLVTRYGGKRGVAVLALVTPLALVVFQGRQTTIDLSSKSDTSQGRIQLWSDGLTLLPSNPVFGIGANDLSDQIGMVAHNSYVQAYVELGLFGGSLFLSAFALAFWGVAKTRPAPYQPRNAIKELAGLRLVILGVLAAYMAGMFSLSRNYIPPTYLNLALATIYLRLAAPDGVRGFVVNGRLLAQVALIGVGGLVIIKVFVMVFARFG